MPFTYILVDYLGLLIPKCKAKTRVKCIYFKVKKSLESDYPGPEDPALRPIHGFATAISRNTFQAEPNISDLTLRTRFSNIE